MSLILLNEEHIYEMKTNKYDLKLDYHFKIFKNTVRLLITLHVCKYCSFLRKNNVENNTN